MFVRWKRHKRIRKRTPERWDENQSMERVTCSAVLVSSERAQGHVRQRVVAYLAGIDEDDLARRTVFNRGLFWFRAVRRLDNLESLDTDQRRAIEQTLSDVVPPLTLAEHNDWIATYGRAWGLSRDMVTNWLETSNLPTPLGPRTMSSPVVPNDAQIIQ